MSIATRRGDDGMTDLMFGRRVPKDHPRVETYGTLDEVNALLGLARVDARHPEVSSAIAAIQAALVPVMGELATHEEDWARWREKGPGVVNDAMVGVLDDLVARLERDQAVRFDHWAVPGAAGNRAGAVLDLARTVTRRAERAIVALDAAGQLPNATLLRWVNRLSDVLWLLARLEERDAPAP